MCLPCLSDSELNANITFHFIFNYTNFAPHALKYFKRTTNTCCYIKQAYQVVLQFKRAVIRAF